jgi:hypothetical protein
MSATNTPDIGPSHLATPTVKGGPAFLLSATEWVAIQVYVNNGLALPTTADAFKASLGSGAPSDLTDFTKLISAYATLHDHVNTWQTDTYPATVSLASDIHQYALNAPTYYNPILPLAQTLSSNPDDQNAAKELAALLGVLSKAAQTNHDRAAAVADKIKTFADQTLADRTTLSGPDGNSGLQKYYSDEYGADSADVMDLTKKLADQQKALADANAEYDHDVVVAATTPTYAWVWPFGTIAAAVVAGVYGKRATDALAAGRAAQALIDTYSAKLAADAKMMIAINTTEAGISNILNKLNAALPIIQKIQGVWGAIRDDLNGIIQLIQTNIAEVPPIIMNMGVTSAINAWTSVGQEADAFRVNAYVTFTEAGQ